MIRLFVVLSVIAVSSSAGVAWAQQGTKGGSVDASTQQRMVVTGDREAPLVLYIVPWQDPKPLSLPDVEFPSVIPKVFDGQIDPPPERTSGKMPDAKE